MNLSLENKVALITGGARDVGREIALIKSLAKEFGRYDITCNAVTLGMIQSAHSDPAWLAENLPKMVRNYPLKRIGRPGDVAPLIALLASDAASWITGQTISVNGGFAMV